MSNIPDWYAFLLLGVASWSLFHLIAHDDLLDRPRRYVLRMGREWQKEGDPVPDDYRLKWGTFLTCPYCCGFWLSIGMYMLWIWLPTATLVVCTAFALRAVVVAAQKLIGRDG